MQKKYPQQQKNSKISSNELVPSNNQRWDHAKYDEQENECLEDQSRIRQKPSNQSNQVYGYKKRDQNNRPGYQNQKKNYGDLSQSNNGNNTNSTSSNNYSNQNYNNQKQNYEAYDSMQQQQKKKNQRRNQNNGSQAYMYSKKNDSYDGKCEDYPNSSNYYNQPQNSDGYNNSQGGYEFDNKYTHNHSSKFINKLDQNEEDDSIISINLHLAGQFYRLRLDESVISKPMELDSSINQFLAEKQIPPDISQIIKITVLTQLKQSMQQESEQETHILDELQNQYLEEYMASQGTSPDNVQSQLMDLKNKVGPRPSQNQYTKSNSTQLPQQSFSYQSNKQKN